jgi:hypothetical protein
VPVFVVVLKWIARQAVFCFGFVHARGRDVVQLLAGRAGRVEPTGP